MRIHKTIKNLSKEIQVNEDQINNLTTQILRIKEERSDLKHQLKAYFFDLLKNAGEKY